MTKITELMPDDLSKSILQAMANGELCRYAQKLEREIDLLEDISKGKHAIISALELKLTAERKKVEKLRGAIEDFVNNDMGRLDTYDAVNHCTHWKQCEADYSDTDED